MISNLEVSGLSRRLARRTALQLLYQIDLTKCSTADALANTAVETPLSSVDQEFAHLLVKGVRERLQELDELIARFAKDWTLERMSVVDRNILRLAIFELRYMPDVPTKVSINEAVELAKAFSDEQAAKFINGILGTVVDYLAGVHNE
jgi:N utilization substance protein B